MHICFVVEGYPTPADPFMTFIKNTVAEMARQGVKCSVIAPQSLTRALAHRVPVRQRYLKDYVSEDGYFVEIYQPKYITLSGRTGRINRGLFIRAAKRAYRKMAKANIDALYAHFWHMGVAASMLDKSKPLFVACGESKICVKNLYSTQSINRMLGQLSGTIYVSTKSFEESEELQLQSKDNPYIILPNGYDPAKFRKMDKESARSTLNWPQNAKIVAFVGAFVPRKGVTRVSEALTQINKKQKVYSCFIGDGLEMPTCPNQLHVGKVDHSMIAEYLNASDVFVLPTTNEGCCNAIIEAMACGLPIISSNLTFNDDILKSSNSIRVDPMDVEAISRAIKELLDNPEKSICMGEKSSELAKSLTIEQRIIKLRTFMEQNI